MNFLHLFKTITQTNRIYPMKKFLLSMILLGLCQLKAQNTLDFDGSNDYIDCGNDTSLQVAGKSITLEAWIYATAWKTNAYDGNVICKEYNTSNYGYMLRVGAGGKLNFALGDGTWHEITTSALMSLNTWYHIAGTYDGVKMRVYIDGVNVDSLSYTGNIAKTPNNNLTLGAHLTYSRYFQGQIDEVRIWSVCKTQAQIASGRNSELCASQSGLRAYYKFNQGKASQSNTNVKKLTDLSGYGNTGTLYNFTLNGSASNWLKGLSLTKGVFNASDTVSVCDRYISPSRRFTWTNSGVYNDTIPTYYGCDSAIKVVLTVRKTTYGAFSAHACDSFISPSKLYVWKTSGVYTDRLKNKVGCDSVITVTLKIGGNRDTIFPVVCKSYTVPSGKRTYTVSGNYFDTLVDYRQCDSIIDIRLTVHQTATSNIVLSGCSSVKSPSNKYTWTQNGNYRDTIKTKKGCDSFINVQVKIKNSSSYYKVSACKTYTTPDGRRTYTSTGIYKDTLYNMAFCDSFITYDVTILQTTYGSVTIQNCRSYISPGKKRKLIRSGIYTDTLKNTRGCDSILTIHLTIPQTNIGVTQNGKHLTALSPSGTFQWLNCNAYVPVNGATNALFTATAIGSYAVEVSDSGCLDTSACYMVTSVGLVDINSVSCFRLSPNPVEDRLYVYLERPLANATVTITDINGKVLKVEKFGELKEESLEFDFVAGTYFVELQAEGIREVQAIVKRP